MMLRTLVGFLLLRGGYVAAQTGADTLDLGDTVVSTAEKTRAKKRQHHAPIPESNADKV